jgi:sugar transferase (PEP-CTERM/EpsH1 system associated)
VGRDLSENSLTLRILFIVPYTPNLIRVRSYNLIRQLAARGHKVTVLTLYASESERADSEALQAFCHRVVALPLARWRSLWNSLLAVPTGVPLQSAYCWQPALARRLNELINGHPEPSAYDIVHVEHLRGARYGLSLLHRRRSGTAPIPVVWDSVDCISLLFRRAAKESKDGFGRWVTRFELGRTEQYEGWLAQQFDHVLLTSPLDRDSLTALVPATRLPAPVSVLANGVDLDYFKPGAGARREPATIVVSGKMSYHANVAMALFLVEDIMPHVWAARPDVKVTIVGKDPPREILSLAQNPAVTVTGTVADLRPYLQQATIAAAPITYGAGVQNKILEAMACATPVVATPQAIAALAAELGRDLLVAQEPAELAELILDLLQDSNRRDAIGRAGRAFVENHHDWAVVTAQLEQIYQKVIERSRMMWREPAS